MGTGMQNCRTVYGQTLVELGRKDERIVVLEADLSKTTMSCLFQAQFPRRYFEMGIGEANMVSTAVGLALCGKVAFVNSFAVFAAGRPYDQVRQASILPGLDLKIVGSSCGLSDYGDGATHQGIEDMAIMRAVPNMTVLCPADGEETAQAVRAAARTPGPFYIRINRNEVPDVLPAGARFRLGKPSVLRRGTEVVLFATGFMVAKSLEAAERLAKEGVSARVINVSTVKPLHEADVRRLASGARAVVTAEEHSVIGGLGSAIAFALRGGGVPIECVAIADEFGQSALDYDQLLAHYGLTADAIARAARRALNPSRARKPPRRPH